MSLETIVPIKTNVPRLQKYLKTLANGAEIQIDYLPKFNALSGGFERKKMVVIGSRPSEGKSTFALQMAYELSSKFRILYLSLEMTVEEAMFRLLCYQQKIENTDIYSGKNYDYNSLATKFEESLKNQERLLIISEEIGKTWDQVEKIFETLGDEPPDLIFLDYIQCITTGGKKLEAIEDYIKNFRKMAIDKNFCLFICSQINRLNISKTKEPTMEGLKNTGFLEEHADKVILLYYPCKRSPTKDVGKYKIIVAKNKNGMTGYLNCNIIPSIYKIYEE